MLTYAYHEILNEVLNRVQQLTPEDKLRLVEDLLANVRQQVVPERRYSVLEFEGIGEETWKDIDVEEFIKQERASWDG